MRVCEWSPLAHRTSYSHTHTHTPLVHTLKKPLAPYWEKVPCKQLVVDNPMDIVGTHTAPTSTGIARTGLTVCQRDHSSFCTLSCFRKGRQKPQSFFRSGVPFNIRRRGNERRHVEEGPFGIAARKSALKCLAVWASKLSCGRLSPSDHVRAGSSTRFVFRHLASHMIVVLSFNGEALGGHHLAIGSTSTKHHLASPEEVPLFICWLFWGSLCFPLPGKHVFCWGSFLS